MFVPNLTNNFYFLNQLVNYHSKQSLMLNQLDNFYLEKQEPIQHCLLALRKIIMAFDKNIVAAWKYGMPFFCYEGKMFCYL